MALGGVATGSMNAQLAASAVATSKGAARTPSAAALAANTGSTVVVTAVLLVNSVRKTTRVATANTTSNMGEPASVVRLDASQPAIDTVTCDSAGQRQAAAEQQQDVPGQTFCARQCAAHGLQGLVGAHCTAKDGSPQESCWNNERVFFITTNDATPPIVCGPFSLTMPAAGLQYPESDRD
jgi:hypothetical protein